jgi:amidohydrolase
MHACGHDAHTAILLGVVKCAWENKHIWTGKLRFIFQPSEEAGSGAQLMINAGVLNDPHVDHIYGLHVMPHLPVGIIETKFGTLNASSDVIKIDVYGTGSHGAYPDKGFDAIICAAQLLTSLQTIISRNIPPISSAVLSFGTINGGTAANIICDNVVLTGTLRTVDEDTRIKIINRIREVAHGISIAYGCDAKVHVCDSTPMLINVNTEVNRVISVYNDIFQNKSDSLRVNPSMGAEDFAYYLHLTSGAFYHIGCTSEEDISSAAPLHSNHFLIDERCIATGLAMQLGLIINK